MMKRVFILLLIIAVLFACAMPASAEEITPEEKIDATTPRLMVIEYSLDSEYVTPDGECTLTVVLKNFCNTKSVRNVKLSFSEESGDIKPVGMGTHYVDAIYAGSKYTWTIKLTAAKTAAIGEHNVIISSEYEDKYYSNFSSSDTLQLYVRQSAGLDHSGIMLPAKLVEGDTYTLDMSLMNTGKCKIRNLKLAFEMEGMVNGGTVFVGEIEAGQSASAKANLRASSELGEKSGTAVISYEDEFGESFSQTVYISTNIVERVTVEAKPEEEEKKNPQWWLFILIGLFVGGTAGAAVPIGISSYKARREDELRL